MFTTSVTLPGRLHQPIGQGANAEAWTHFVLILLLPFTLLSPNLNMFLIVNGSAGRHVSNDQMSRCPSFRSSPVRRHRLRRALERSAELAAGGRDLRRREGVVGCPLCPLRLQPLLLACFRCRAETAAGVRRTRPVPVPVV